MLHSSPSDLSHHVSLNGEQCREHVVWLSLRISLKAYVGLFSTLTTVQTVLVLHNFLVPGDEPPEIPGLAFREVPEHAPQRISFAGHQVL